MKIICLSFSFLLMINCHSQSLKERISRFDNKVKQGQHNLALQIIDSAITDNPFHGIVYFKKAELLTELNESLKAVNYYKKALSLGYRIAETNLRIAEIFSKSKKPNRDSIVFYLKKSLQEDNTKIFSIEKGSSLDPYKGLVFGSGGTALGKNERWKKDLEYLYNNLSETHYSPFERYSKKEIKNYYTLISNSIPKWNDSKIITELMRLTAMFGDGHTVLVPPTSGRYQFHRYPLYFYWFKDGIYCLGGDTAYHELYGKKINKFNGHLVSSVIDRLKAYLPSDNEMQMKWLVPYAMLIPELLYATGIMQDIKSPLELEFSQGNELKKYKLYDSKFITAELLENFVYVSEFEKSWKGVKTYNTDLLEKNYGLQLKGNTILMRFNQVKPDPDLPIDVFTKQLDSAINRTEAKALIIDLRNNEGGDNSILAPFVLPIIAKWHKQNDFKVTALTGRRTFSAAISFLGQLQKYIPVLVAGEPTSGKANFIGEANPFQLPYSGIWVNSSKYFHQNTYAFDKRPWITPDLWLEPTFLQWLSADDWILEAVLSR